MPPPTARMETYRALDQAAALHSLSATLDGRQHQQCRLRFDMKRKTPGSLYLREVAISVSPERQSRPSRM